MRQISLSAQVGSTADAKLAWIEQSLREIELASYEPDATVPATYTDAVDARAYGLAADGAADDTGPLLAALSAAGANGTVRLPAGTIMVRGTPSTSTIILSAGQRIVGAGRGKTIVKLTASAISPGGQSLFMLNGTNQTIEALSVDGSGHTDIQGLIYTNGATRPRIVNVELKGSGCNQAAAYVLNSTLAEITDLEIEAFSGSIGSQTTRSHGLILNNVSKGDTLHTIRNVRVAGGLFGISLWRQQLVTLSDFRVYDVIGGPGAGDGINIDDSSRCSISNGVIQGRNDSGVVVYTTNPATSIPEENVFSNITSNANLYDGVYLTAGRNNIFNGLVTCENDQDFVHANLASPRYGVYVTIDSGGITDRNFFNGLIARDLQSTKTQAYGAAVTAGPTNTAFLNCALAGNRTGNLNDAGTGTILFEADGNLTVAISNVLKAISYGANDSGGVGFKVMRVPN